MAEFCECGSLVIDGRCSNKNCSHRAAGSPAGAKKTSAKPRAAGKINAGAKPSAKPAAKAPNPRRASKVVTYNLYDSKNQGNAQDAQAEKESEN